MSVWTAKQVINMYVLQLSIEIIVRLLKITIYRDIKYNDLRYMFQSEYSQILFLIVWLYLLDIYRSRQTIKNRENYVML